MIPSCKLCTILYLLFYILFSGQESNMDDYKKLSASYENLSEATTSKVLMLSDDVHQSEFLSSAVDY